MESAVDITVYAIAGASIVFIIWGMGTLIDDAARKGEAMGWVSDERRMRFMERGRYDSGQAKESQERNR